MTIYFLYFVLKNTHIDSRDQTPDSASHTDYKVQLRIYIILLPNTGFYITDITIPVSFCIVEGDRNHNIYFSDKNNQLFQNIASW